MQISASPCNPTESTSQQAKYYWTLYPHQGSSSRCQLSLFERRGKKIQCLANAIVFTTTIPPLSCTWKTSVWLKAGKKYVKISQAALTQLNLTCSQVDKREPAQQQWEALASPHVAHNKALVAAKKLFPTQSFRPSHPRFTSLVQICEYIERNWRDLLQNRLSTLSWNAMYTLAIQPHHQEVCILNALSTTQTKQNTTYHGYGYRREGSLSVTTVAMDKQRSNRQKQIYRSALRIIHHFPGNSKLLMPIYTEGRGEADNQAPVMQRQMRYTAQIDEGHIVFSHLSAGNLEKLYIDLEEYTTKQIQKVFQDSLEGLASFHRQGFLHRNLKPSNVILTNHSSFGVRIADFKESCLPSEAKKRFFAGTPGTMSPEGVTLATEQKAPPLTQASDVFAWGLTMFPLIAGGEEFPWAKEQKKFAWGNILLACRTYSLKVRDKAFSLTKEAPPILVEIVLAALHPDPQKRPSAENLLERLNKSTALPQKILT